MLKPVSDEPRSGLNQDIRRHAELAAPRLGLSMIDTAELYGDGAARRRGQHVLAG